MTDYTVKFGDVWRMGRHRLLCGDSTERAMVEEFLEGHRPKLCISDPPYGMDYSARSHSGGLYELKVKNDHVISWSDAFRCAESPVLYVWFNHKHYDIVARAIKEAGFEVKQMIVWVKNKFAFQRHYYHLRHEQVLFCVRRGERKIWTGDRKQVSVWEAPTVRNKDRIHPTEKPTRVYTIPILNHTHEGDPVIDLFAGSGTVFAACEETRRTGLGIELSPKVCIDILCRMSRSGLEVEHEGNLFDR